MSILNRALQRGLNLSKILTRYISAFGFQAGIRVYWRIRNAVGVSSIDLPGYPSPIFLRADSKDRVVFEMVMMDGEYECEYYDAIPETIVDAGANIGLTSLYFARKYPSAKIFAIEPDRGNFEILERNCKEYNSIEVFNGAIWPEETSVTIANPEAGSTAFMVKKDEDNSPFTVPTLTMDQVLDRIGGSVDLLKLDIEGGEKDLFEAENLEWLTNVQAIVIETHDRFAPGSSKAFYQAISSWDYAQHMIGMTAYVVKNQHRSTPSS